MAVWKVVPSRFWFFPSALVVEGSVVRRAVIGRTRRHAVRRAALWAAENGAPAVVSPNPRTMD